MTVEVETGTEEDDEELEDVFKVEVTEAVEVETDTEGLLVLVLEELTRLEDAETVDVAMLVLVCKVLLLKSSRREQRPQALGSAAQLPRMGSH